MRRTGIRGNHAVGNLAQREERAQLRAGGGDTGQRCGLADGFEQGRLGGGAPEDEHRIGHANMEPVQQLRPALDGPDLVVAPAPILFAAWRNAEGWSFFLVPAVQLFVALALVSLVAQLKQHPRVPT